jgi:hypothetical protein
VLPCETRSNDLGPSTLALSQLALCRQLLLDLASLALDAPDPDQLSKSAGWPVWSWLAKPRDLFVVQRERSPGSGPAETTQLPPRWSSPIWPTPGWRHRSGCSGSGPALRVGGSVLSWPAKPCKHLFMRRARGPVGPAATSWGSPRRVRASTLLAGALGAGVAGQDALDQDQLFKSAAWPDWSLPAKPCTGMHFAMQFARGPVGPAAMIWSPPCWCSPSEGHKMEECNKADRASNLARITNEKYCFR